MIYYDVTKMDGAKARSGLTRTSMRLLRELDSTVQRVVWDGRQRSWLDADTQKQPELVASDWLLTVELFSEAERPGFREFIASRPCQLAAMFYDAIPLRLPHITWPQSVQRHPEYMKLLANCDRVFAISEDVARDLAGFWQWQGVLPRAEMSVVELGADFDGSERVVVLRPPAPGARASLLCVGIIEPRKNQSFLLAVCDSLWRDGLDFDLHVAGRVNPHFGEPIAKQLKQAAKREPRVHYHAAPDDRVLQRLYTETSAVVFPTIAEGNGLPILEASWRGVPCVCSDLPVLRENTAGGGCLLARVNDLADWREKLRAVLTDAGTQARLRREAVSRPLPRWADTAQQMRAVLR